MNDLIDLDRLESAAQAQDTDGWRETVSFACLPEGLERVCARAAAGPLVLAACGDPMHGATFAEALARQGIPAERLTRLDLRAMAFRRRSRTLATEEALEATRRVQPLAQSHELMHGDVLLVGSGPVAQAVSRELAAIGARTLLMSREPETLVWTEMGPVLSWSAGEPRVSRFLIVVDEPVERTALDPEAFPPHPSIQILGQTPLQQASSSSSGPTIEPPTQSKVRTVVLAFRPGSHAAAAHWAGAAVEQLAARGLELADEHPGARLVLIVPSTTGLSPRGARLLAAFQREVGGVFVGGPVGRVAPSSGRLWVHGTDIALGRRIAIPSDLVVVHPGWEEDPLVTGVYRRLQGDPDAPRPDRSEALWVSPRGMINVRSPHPIGPDQARVLATAAVSHVYRGLPAFKAVAP